MLTIDELRKLPINKLVYHPVGAIRLTYDWTNVYHFYSDQSPMVEKENLHTHPYSFRSTVHKGSLRNIIYHYGESDSETPRHLQERACRAGSCMQTIYENVDFYEAAVFDTFVGESYYMHNTVLHKIELLEPKVITLVEKEPVVADALFLLDKGVEWKDEELFGLKTEEECWEIIEYTLSD